MNYHSYLMITGHGLSAIPIAPFRISRPDGADLPLHIRHAGLECRIADASDACDPELVELRDGPDQAVWSLVTSVFVASWPDGFEVVSSPAPDVPPGFDLVGPHEGSSSCRVRSRPTRSRSLDALAAPGQTLRNSGVVDNVQWVWLEYDHDGTNGTRCTTSLRSAVLFSWSPYRPSRIPVGRACA